MPNGRKLTSILRGRPLHFVQHPIIASLLNVGGLWMLYTTDLFLMMHGNLFLYVIIHVHVFLAGYVFTISIISIDLVPLRKGYLYRTVVFLFVLAGHSFYLNIFMRILQMGSQKIKHDYVLRWRYCRGRVCFYSLLSIVQKKSPYVQ